MYTDHSYYFYKDKLQLSHRIDEVDDTIFIRMYSWPVHISLCLTKAQLDAVMDEIQNAKTNFDVYIASKEPKPIPEEIRAAIADNPILAAE